MSCRTRGFTLIELSMVVGIIGILAAVALPAYQDYTLRARVAEGFPLAQVAQRAIAEYYDRWGRLPADNAAAGLPRPALARGAEVVSITVKDGAIDVRFSPRFKELEKGLSIRPAVNVDNPTAPLLWICSPTAKAPAGYDLIGGSQTGAIADRYVPAVCR